MTEELKELHALITDVRLDIRELNTKMDGIKDLTRKVEETQAVAIKAMDSTQAAHHRIDRVDKIIFWAGTTTFGALIVGVVAFIIKGGLNVK